MSMVADNIAKSDDLWFCRVCGYSSKNRGHVAEHIECVHLKLKVVCPVCGEQFIKNKFRVHKKKCFSSY